MRIRMDNTIATMGLIMNQNCVYYLLNHCFLNIHNMKFSEIDFLQNIWYLCPNGLILNSKFCCIFGAA